MLKRRNNDEDNYRGIFHVGGEGYLYVEKAKDDKNPLVSLTSEFHDSAEMGEHHGGVALIPRDMREIANHLLALADQVEEGR